MAERMISRTITKIGESFEGDQKSYQLQEFSFQNRQRSSYWTYGMNSEILQSIKSTKGKPWWVAILSRFSYCDLKVCI